MLQSNNRYWLWWGVIVLVALVLRVVQLGSLPPSLYWEEVALGYDAYAIAQTAHDHHGNFLPIVAFESFGDWKPGLYIYALVPFVKIFGLQEWVIRLPSVMAGVLIVIGVGQLMRLWLPTKHDRSWSLVAMALTAISPWAIQFSRGAWEANLATALLLWGVVLGWHSLPLGKKFNARSWWMVPAVVLFSLSLYAYHAAKLVAPALGLGVVAVWVWHIWQQRLPWKMYLRVWLAALLVGLVVAAPMLLAFGSATVQQRFAETNIFSDIEIIKASNARIEAAGNHPLSKLVYHRYFFFGGAILENFFSHFKFDFLFVNGDSNPRHSTQFFGLLYPIEVLFLLLGLYAVAKKWSAKAAYLAFWLVIGIVPASLTWASPHALRILVTLPVWMALLTLGIRQLLAWVSPRWQRLALFLIVVLYLGQLAVFWRHYSLIYPKQYSSEWQYGYKEMIASVAAAHQENPDGRVYITREQGRPAMYYWFFTQTDPSRVQAADATAAMDQGEYVTFENIAFINTVNEVGDEGIVAASADGFEQLSASYPVQQLAEIKNVKGEVIWVVFRVHNEVSDVE